VRMTGMLGRTVREIFDLLFPPSCAVCGSPGARGGVCDACFRAVVFTAADRCLGCGRILEPYAGVRPRCNECRSARHSFRYAFAAGRYGGTVKVLIHRLKYEGDFSVLPALREMVAHAVKVLDFPADYDRVVPVPLFLWDEVRRGFNQSALIAAYVAGFLGVPLSSVLKKTRRTPKQVRLSGSERRKNLRGVFSCAPGVCTEEKVLVVDDVFTTGTTLSECAAALRNQGGAARVDVFTLAR